MILAAEMLLLVAAAFFTSERWDMAVNVTVSFICSLQAESFRLLNGNSYATTMCTVSYTHLPWNDYGDVASAKAAHP